MIKDVRKNMDTPLPLPYGTLSTPSTEDDTVSTGFVVVVSFLLGFSAGLMFALSDIIESLNL